MHNRFTIYDTEQNDTSSFCSYLTLEKKEGETPRDVFYNTYKDRFPTRYGSTLASEDIAEAFRDYVIHENKYTGTTIADQKVQWIEPPSKLKQIAEDVRENVKEIYGVEYLETINVEPE